MKLLIQLGKLFMGWQGHPFADAVRPQRHTAMRIFERLRDEQSYAGGYDAVRRFVKKHRSDQRETFIPLDHDPGQRLEADFGKIYVDFPDGRRQVSVLILVWPYSNAPFAVALPTERTESILEGMVQAFEFFGSVPREVWWDNPKTVAVQLLSGRDRKLNSRYAALASHYVFSSTKRPRRLNNEPLAIANDTLSVERDNAHARNTPPRPSDGPAHYNEKTRQQCQRVSVL